MMTTHLGDDLWWSCPLSVSQRVQLGLPSLRGRTDGKVNVRRQTTEGVLRGVAYRLHQWVFSCS